MDRANMNAKPYLGLARDGCLSSTRKRESFQTRLSVTFNQDRTDQIIVSDIRQLI
jgi:hypothetical protein